MLPHRRATAVLALLSSVIAVRAVAGEPARIPATMDAATVPGYRPVTATFASAGKPTAEGLAAIAAAGFKTVIDLLPPDEAAKDEAATLARLGIRYVSIPVKGTDVDWDKARDARAVLEDPKSGPVLVHCKSGNRVGGLYALVQALHGASTKDALAEGQRAGMASAPLRERVEGLLAAGPEKVPATQPTR